MNLNVTYLNRRRRELALSTRQLAKGVGLSAPRTKLVLEGQVHDTLTLQHVQAFADTLACHVTDLLEPAGPDEAADAADADQLPATLAALLATANTGVHITTLAEATSHDIPAVETALDILDRQLQRCGLTIRRNANDGSLTIVAGALLTDSQVETVLRGAATRRQLDIGTARVVHHILTGPTTRRKVEASNDGRARLGQLINAGIVTEPAAATVPLELADDVRESLLLDAR